MRSTIRIILAEDGGQTYTANVRLPAVTRHASATPLFSAPVVSQPNNPNTGIVTIPTGTLTDGTIYNLTVNDNADDYVYAAGFFKSAEGDVATYTTEAEAVASNNHVKENTDYGFSQTDRLGTANPKMQFVPE